MNCTLLRICNPKWISIRVYNPKICTYIGDLQITETKTCACRKKYWSKPHVSRPHNHIFVHNIVLCISMGSIINTELYFITTTVVDWIDVFTRPKYKHIVLDSLTYCQQNKGLKIYAWVLMSNHLHMIVSVEGQGTMADIMRDFKKYTSKQVMSELQNDLQESRREWMLDRFRFAAFNDTKVTNYRLWQDGYYPELLYSEDFYRQKLEYIHNNPVIQEIVTCPEDYLYSSAKDYAGEKGLIEVTVER